MRCRSAVRRAYRWKACRRTSSSSALPTKKTCGGTPSTDTRGERRIGSASAIEVMQAIVADVALDRKGRSKVIGCHQPMNSRDQRASALDQTAIDETDRRILEHLTADARV